MSGTRYTVELELRRLGGFHADDEARKVAKAAKEKERADTKAAKAVAREEASLQRQQRRQQEYWHAARWASEQKRQRDAERAAHKSARDAQQHVSNLKGGLSDLRASGGALGAALDWAGQKVFGIAKYAAAIGGTAALAGITYGVAGLNAELERAQVGLGVIFNAQGITGTVPEGIRMAADTVEKMRIDAQKLPGEFEDLMNIYSTGAVSVFKAGKTPDEWRELASKAMVAGSVAMMPLDQVAREFAQLVEGRSGAHNVFGNKLMGLAGGEAEKFNKLSIDDRMGFLSKELDKWSGGLDAFAHSWEGASSTFVDNLKNTGRLLTEPLFHKVVDQLIAMNDWFDDNRSMINMWAGYLGNRLVDAFEWGKAKILEWYPIVAQFAETAWTRLTAFWVDVQPYVESFAVVLKDALADPNGTIDKLITLAEIWAGLKVGGLAVDAAVGTANVITAATTVATGARWAARAAGLGGAASAAAGAAGTTAAAGTAGTAAAAGAAGAAAGGGALAAIGAAAAPVAAFMGALLVAYESWSYVFTEGAAVMAELDREKQLNHDAMIAMGEREIEAMSRAGMSLEDMQAKVGDTSAKLALAGNEMAAAFLQDKFAAEQLAAEFESVANRINGIVIADAIEANNLAILQQARNFLNPNGADPKKAPKHKGGGGGTSIQKVEIVVTSNNDPSRVAREVVAELNKLTRNQTASRRAPSFMREGWSG